MYPWHLVLTDLLKTLLKNVNNNVGEFIGVPLSVHARVWWQSLSGGSTGGDGWPIRARHVSKMNDPRVSGVCQYEVGMWRSKAMIARDPRVVQGSRIRAHVVRLDAIPPSRKLREMHLDGKLQDCPHNLGYKRTQPDLE
ncbi:hypothetical protein Tco_1555730 [Tanacetum coccineum]